MLRVLHLASRMLAPENEVGQHQHQRDHEQEMDYTSQGITGYEAEQPQNEQNYRNGV
jgi:hypothetical protein